MRKERKDIQLASLLPNDGQAGWLPSNPREWTKDDINKTAKSIKEDPDFLEERPILVIPFGNEFIVFAGNLRREGCAKNKMKTAPCVIHYPETDEDKDTIIRRAMKDNGSFGKFDWDKVANEWDAYPLADWGVPAWETEEEQAPQAQAQEDDFNEESDAVETRCKAGDIWELGEHRLMCGDSTDAASVALLMNGEKADMVFTDPPYGLGIDGQKKSVCKNPKHNRKAHEFRDWDSHRPDKSVFDYIVSLNVPSCIFGGNYFADLLPATRGWIYWSKGQDGLSMSDGELAWTNMDKPLRAVVVNRAVLQGSMHPTQKPVQVVEFSLNYLGGGESVLDLFGGSGTTLIAAEQLGRRCYMMELDPHYCDVILARWEKLTGQTAHKI